jgi:hypothetical protein
MNTTQKRQQLCDTALEVHPQSALLSVANQPVPLTALKVLDQKLIDKLVTKSEMNREMSSSISEFFMKRITLFAEASLISTTLAVSMLSFTPVAQASRCRTIAHDWDGSVDVRSQPRRNIFNLITTVPNGTHLDVIGQHGDWLEVYVLGDRWNTNYQIGWVAKRATRRTCSRDDKPWYPSSSLPPLPPLPPLSPQEEYDDDY